MTVYQRGFRLGGKGASSAGPHGRIQEHGLHVWPGYYDNAFRMMGACYEELDRSHTDPAVPIQTFDDAFFAASTIGLVGDGVALPWVATFPENDFRPESRTTPKRDPSGRATCSSEEQRCSELSPSRSSGPSRRYGPCSAPAGTRHRVHRWPGLGAGRLQRSASAPLARGFAELVGAMMRGIIADMLPTRGYTAIDHLDFCAWLKHHGASSLALSSPLIRGMYDLVFGYEGGDRNQPGFSAGTGLHLAGRMFLTYRGAIFWKMRAGMGDVIFAPLYELLHRRGVRFAFFRQVERLGLAPDRKSVDEIVVTRQARRRTGHDEYLPLVRVADLPVFPDRADHTQLATGSRLGEDLESHTPSPSSSAWSASRPGGTSTRSSSPSLPG